jgi:hypothetical protein
MSYLPTILEEPLEYCGNVPLPYDFNLDPIDFRYGFAFEHMANWTEQYGVHCSVCSKRFLPIVWRIKSMNMMKGVSDPNIFFAWHKNIFGDVSMKYLKSIRFDPVYDKTLNQIVASFVDILLSSAPTTPIVTIGKRMTLHYWTYCNEHMDYLTALCLKEFEDSPRLCAQDKAYDFVIHRYLRLRMTLSRCLFVCNQMWHFYNLDEKITTDKESARAATLLDAQNFLEMPLNEAPPSNEENINDWAFEYFENPNRFNPFIAFYF